MDVGFSGKAFDNILLIALVLSIAVYLGAFAICYKMRIDVTKPRFVIALSLSCGFVFIIPLFWFTRIPTGYKIAITIIAPALSVANYLAINRRGLALRQNLMEKKDNQSKEEAIHQ